MNLIKAHFLQQSSEGIDVSSRANFTSPAPTFVGNYLC